MNSPVDIYCERLDHGLWAEPVNAITNLAFVLVGCWLLLGPSRAGRALGLIEICVGLGSLAFHTFATRWSAILDVAFIGVFIIAFAYLAPRVLWGSRVSIALAASLLVVGLVVVMSLLANPLRDLLGAFPPGLYVGAWLSLLLYYLLTRRFGDPGSAQALLVAVLLFPISLTARELDEPLCALFALGTHWMWHLLNALVLGACGLAFHRAARASSGSLR